MKLPDPDIQTGPWEKVRDGVQRNLDALARALPGVGGRSVEFRFGTGTATWPGGGAASGGVTVTHGLGATPISVVCGSRDTLFEYVVTARGATTFTVVGYATNNVVVAASSRTFDWVAFA